jgi:hypothetical protein
VTRTSRAILGGVVLVTTACGDDCEKKVRQSLAFGRLGDSTVAVNPSTDSGEVYLYLVDRREPVINERYGDVYVDLSGLSDSVSLIRLARFSDATRASLLQIPHIPSSRPASTRYFQATNFKMGSALFETLFAVFSSGDGMVEVQRFNGPPVSARLKPEWATDLLPNCQGPT